MLRFTNFLSCHTVGTVTTSNDIVLPEISCTTHDVISAKMAAGYLRVSLMPCKHIKLPRGSSSEPLLALNDAYSLFA